MRDWDGFAKFSDGYTLRVKSGRGVEVYPSVKGRATQFDKDVLIYVISQMTEALNRGRTDANNRAVRFVVFDYLVSTNKLTGGSQYKQLEIALDRLAGTRLKTDIKTLKGQKVSVLGQVQMMGELAMLKANPMDMTPIMLDITKLPRDDRKQMLKSCTVICDNVRVNGSVHPGMMGDTLIAEQLVWQ